MNEWATVAIVMAVLSVASGAYRLMRRKANWKSTSVMSLALAIEFAGLGTSQLVHSLTWDRIAEGASALALILFIWAATLRTAN